MNPYTHIRFDKDLNRYKHIHKIFGIPLSHGWKVLPDIKKVALSKVKISQTFNSAKTFGNSSTVHVEMYAVFLFGSKKSIRIDAGKFEEFNAAKKEAGSMANLFNVALLDFTK